MKKGKTPMDKLTEGYEKFIKGKELAKNSSQIFDRAIKKASKPKPRSSK